MNTSDGNGVERLPPHDLEAERSLLGGFLVANQSIDDAQVIVQPECFYADAHRRICAAMYSMRSGLNAVDAVTLGHELERRGELVEVGGPGYLAQLLEAVPHAAHTEYYARIVREAWVRRRIIDACQDSLRDAFAASVETDEVLARHDTATQRLLETGVNTEATVSIGAVLMQAVEHAQSEDKSRTYIQTGYHKLDEKLGGVYGQNLFVIAARASMGKTAFALNVMLNMAARGCPVLFFSLEQGVLELAERLLSIESGVPTHAMRSGMLTDAQSDAIVEAQNALANLPVWIDETAEMQVPKIAAKARLWKRRHSIRAVVIDYLQLIEPDNERVNREQQVAKISKGLKRLAKSLDVPVIVLAQLNREVEKRTDKRPILSDLRESGSVEQDADQVCFIHRPEYYEPDSGEHVGKAELHLAKNRNGPRAVKEHCIKLKWTAETMRFDNAQDEFDFV